MNNTRLWVVIFMIIVASILGGLLVKSVRQQVFPQSTNIPQIPVITATPLSNSLSAQVIGCNPPIFAITVFGQSDPQWITVSNKDTGEMWMIAWLSPGDKNNGVTFPGSTASGLGDVRPEYPGTTPLSNGTYILKVLKADAFPLKGRPNPTNEELTNASVLTETSFEVNCS
jgi:hypothetical protein